jgi:hypothetical protein
MVQIYSDYYPKRPCLLQVFDPVPEAEEEWSGYNMACTLFNSLEFG